MATLDLNQISKSFGTAQVLYDIDLAIRDKEFVVFVFEIMGVIVQP